MLACQIVHMVRPWFWDKEEIVTFLSHWKPCKERHWIMHTSCANIEDVRRMIGCTCIYDAVVFTWYQKLWDNSGSRKKTGTSCILIHHWLIICHFVNVSVAKIKFTNVWKTFLKAYTTGEVKESPIMTLSERCVIFMNASLIPSRMQMNMLRWNLLWYPWI